MYEHITTLTMGDFISSINIYTMDNLSNRMRESSVIIIDEGLLRGMEQSAFYKSADRVDIVENIVGNIPYIIIPGGEIGKSRFCVNLLLETLFSLRLSRVDSILVMGGGAVCDMVSFVASTYMRGLSLTLVPSSLLAMVDASIGGKTGINFAHLKNMVGAFYPADEIIIIPELLQFLSSALLQDGLAEIIKAGCLHDESIITLLEEHPELYTEYIGLQAYAKYSEYLKKLIVQAIQVKSYFVENDFKEKNIRAYLNLGHTFAHAYEASARQKGATLSHGAAVGLGIRSALCLGLLIQDEHKKPFTNSAYAHRIGKLLDGFDYPKNYEGYSSDELINHMYMDKKRMKQQIRFVLQYDMGRTEIIPVEKPLVKEVLQTLGAL